MVFRPELLQTSEDTLLMASAFWNFLREDITFSLYEECPLKLELDHMPIPSNMVDHDGLNTLSLLLGRTINAMFGYGFIEDEWETLLQSANSTFENFPISFRPFSKNFDNPLPTVLFLQEVHGE